MRREQKTEQGELDFGYPGGNRVEPEGTEEARSIAAPETTERDSVEKRHTPYPEGRKPDGNLLNQVLGIDNMFDACERVIRNGGTAGVDGMRVEELQPYLIAHYQELEMSIRGGWYKPKPVRRVEIPKPDGGKRLLGVPTVVDRMVQQAMVQVLQPIFEQTFSDSSYGFRPGRSAQQAIQRAKGYFEEGYTYVVDLDLEKYFDTVNHDLLIKMVRETVKDEAVIALVRKFLKSGVMVDRLVSQTEQGTPQGGNLSPLLSNIYLTKFDRMLEERGHKFVRYADDCNIYVKSLRAAGRVMESCTKFLEGKLKLKVNRKKSTTGSPTRLKFLGFSLYRRKKEIRVRAHEKSLQRLKDRLKALTSRKRGGTIEQILQEVSRLLTGWIGYYSMADLKSHLRNIIAWVRRRVRQLLWKRWKKARTRYGNLIKLGIPEDLAWPWANTRKSYWHTAGSQILKNSLTNHYLESIGFPKAIERFEMLHQRIDLLIKLRAPIPTH
jgi:group II intron reverse transcriptase/maturase